MKPSLFPVALCGAAGAVVAAAEGRACAGECSTGGNRRWRMALWERGREGHPAVVGELIHHSDTGSHYTSIRPTDHLALEATLPSIGSVDDADY